MFLRQDSPGLLSTALTLPQPLVMLRRDENAFRIRRLSRLVSHLRRSCGRGTAPPHSPGSLGNKTRWKSSAVAGRQERRLPGRAVGHREK